MSIRRNGRAFLLSTLLVAAGQPAWTQEAVLEAQNFLRAANAAYQEGDYGRLVSNLERAAELNPASLATRYNLACAYALLDQKSEALRLLETLVEARVDFGMADDDDLASLQEDPRFRELLSELDDRLEPVSTSRRLFALDDIGLIPEGIAVDTATGRTFISSMRTGEIHVVTPPGEVSVFATPDSRRRLAALGLRVDEARNRLWSIGAPLEIVEGHAPGAKTRSGLFGFDLDSGELQEKYLAAPEVGNFNDLAIAADGDLYLSGETLSIVRAGSDRIEPLRTDPFIAGSNGIALTPDARQLFVASYPVGIAVVDLESGAARFLEAPADQPLYGIDGLYLHGDELLAIQNGITPWRLVRLALDDELTTVTGTRLMEFVSPDLVMATTAAIIGSELRYVAREPAPANPPNSIPPTLVPLSGKTVVMSAPLD